MDKEDVRYIDRQTHTHTHTETHYSDIKIFEILPFITTWMDPEAIRPSEISLTEKDKYSRMSLIYGI